MEEVGNLPSCRWFAALRLLSERRRDCRCWAGGTLVCTFVVRIAVANLAQYGSNPRITIHLRTLSDGSNHPAAQFPAIYYSPQGAMSRVRGRKISITNSRLMLRMICWELRHSLVIWDWKSGQILCVSQYFSWPNKADLETLRKPCRSLTRNVTLLWSS